MNFFFVRAQLFSLMSFMIKLRVLSNEVHQEKSQHFN